MFTRARLLLITILLLTTVGHAAAQSTGGAELIGYAELPADTFAPGPDSGQFEGTGGRGADVKDNNEIIWLQLATPLTLAEGVGMAQ